MREVIRNVGELLSEQINYRYLRWRGKAKYPYFVGELYKDGTGDESGESGFRFLLTGFYRGDDEIQLLEAADRVIEMVPEDTGRLVRCRDGLMLISAGDVLTDIPTDSDTELSKIQITLEIRRWKGKG